ncbi:MAG: hypothetical protein K2Y21_10605 [Phycisphaerales bacterium]|nr:hypothetical protein [Phycisphaerales bacterium]
MDDRADIALERGLTWRAINAARGSLRGPDWLWLLGCVPCLWIIGIVLGLDDAEKLGSGYDPSAPDVAAWGLAIGVGSIWLWRRWLIRNHPSRPAHDAATDALLLTGAFGALGLYLAIVPGHKLLPPNTTMCLLSGVAGAALLHSAWTRRVGTSFHCSRCNYQIDDFSLPRRCPECAGVWAHKLLRGRVERSVPLVAASVILLFLLTLAPLPRLDATSPLVRRMTPTSWIVARAMERLQASRVLESAWWQELTRRRLDESDAETLRALIMTEQQSSRLLDSNAYSWLQGELFAGRGSEGLYRQFMEDALAAAISVRDARGTTSPVARAGEGLIVRPRFDELRRVPRDRIAVFVEGIWKDDDATPLLRSSKWELLSELAIPEVLQTPTDSVRDGASLTPWEPQRLTFSARYWVAVVPGGTPPNATPENMQNQLPPSVPWMGKFEARRQVNVVGQTPEKAPTR